MDPTGLAKDAAYHNIIHMQSSAFKIQYDPIYKRSVAAYAQPCQPSRIEGARHHGSMAPEAVGAPPIFHSALPDRRCPCGVIRATFASSKACERSQKKRSEQDVGRCWEFEFDTVCLMSVADLPGKQMTVEGKMGSLKTGAYQWHTSTSPKLQF